MRLNPSIVKPQQKQIPLLYLTPSGQDDDLDEEDSTVVLEDEEEDLADEILVEHDWEEVDDEIDDLDDVDAYGYQDDEDDFVLNT
jgi:hypothetical protein